MPGGNQRPASPRLRLLTTSTTSPPTRDTDSIEPTDYLAEIERVREQYGDRLTILAGAEVDYHDDTRDVVEQFMAEWGNKYDFVIGSVHYGEKGEIIFPEFFDWQVARRRDVPVLRSSRARRADRLVRHDRSPRYPEAVHAPLPIAITIRFATGTG